MKQQTCRVTQCWVKLGLEHDARRRRFPVRLERTGWPAPLLKTNPRTAPVVRPGYTASPKSSHGAASCVQNAALGAHCRGRCWRPSSALHRRFQWPPSEHRGRRFLPWRSCYSPAVGSAAGGWRSSRRRPPRAAAAAGRCNAVLWQRPRQPPRPRRRRAPAAAEAGRGAVGEASQTDTCRTARTKQTTRPATHSGPHWHQRTSRATSKRTHPRAN